MNMPSPLDSSAPVYPGLPPNFPPFPQYTPFGAPGPSMHYPMPPMMQMAPDVVEDMKRGKLTQTEPAWEMHMKGLPEELQSVLFASLSALIQRTSPEVAEDVLKNLVWEVWKSRHAHYANAMNARMALGTSSNETIETELARHEHEVITAMHTGMKKYYETRDTPNNAPTTM